VNWVNWLQAKAWSDWWNEELLLCHLEMTWTINAFAHRKTFWTDLKTGFLHIAREARLKGLAGASSGLSCTLMTVPPSTSMTGYATP
jgi:hypothetical protein